MQLEREREARLQLWVEAMKTETPNDAGDADGAYISNLRGGEQEALHAHFWGEDDLQTTKKAKRPTIPTLDEDVEMMDRDKQDEGKKRSTEAANVDNEYELKPKKKKRKLPRRRARRAKPWPPRRPTA